jgi:hypothetical protein
MMSNNDFIGVKISRTDKQAAQNAVARKGWSLSFVIKTALSAFVRGDKRIFAIIEDALKQK